MGMSMHERSRRIQYKLDRGPNKTFIDGLKAGDEVAVVLAGCIKVEKVTQVLDGPLTIVERHGCQRTLRGRVIETASQGYFGANGDGVLQRAVFLTPVRPHFKQKQAMKDLLDSGFDNRLTWFTASGWPADEVIDMLARIMRVESGRHDLGWLENHFRERDDRQDTLTLVKLAFPEHAELAEEKLGPYRDAWLQHFEAREERRAEMKANSGVKVRKAAGGLMKAGRKG